MTAPAWRSAGTAATHSPAANSITPALPAGWALNDIFVVLVAVNGAATLTLPGGWTAISGSPAISANGYRVYYYWKRATSSESAPAISSSTTNIFEAQIAAISGAITFGTPVEAGAYTDHSSSGTTTSWPSITTTGSDALIFLNCYGFGGSASGYTNASLTGLTERVDFAAANADGWVTVTGALAAAGATGTTTGTWASSTTCVSMAMAIKSDSAQTVNGTDNSTNVIETTNIVASSPAADTSGLTADTATAAVTITGADVSGLTTDLAGVRIADSDAFSGNESMHVLAGGATLVFASDSSSQAVEAVGPMVIKDNDTMSMPDGLQSAALGIQGILPPGPRIVRIGQSTTTG